MSTNDAVSVSRRDLQLQLVLYVLLAGGGGLLIAVALRRLIDFYPVSVAMNFAITGLLLFPAFRVWKQTRGHQAPSFGSFAVSLSAASVGIFALSWIGTRMGFVG